MISAAQTLSMMTTTAKSIDIAIAVSIMIQAVISTFQGIGTAMQKAMSNIIVFTASKKSYFLQCQTR